MFRSVFSAGSSAKTKLAAIRQPQYEGYHDDDDDDDDDSISSYEGSDSGSDARLPSSSRDASRQESRQLGPAPAGGQAPPGQSTRGFATAAHALPQPVPEWGMREPANRLQNPNVDSPGFESSRIRSPASTNYDPDPFAAKNILPNQRSVPGTNFSIPRKPVNKPGKKILIAVFGMTGTGKTSFIKTLAGEAASQLRTGHNLESCMYFYLQSLYSGQLTYSRHSGNRDS